MLFCWKFISRSLMLLVLANILWIQPHKTLSLPVRMLHSDRSGHWSIQVLVLFQQHFCTYSFFMLCSVLQISSMKFAIECVERILLQCVHMFISPSVWQPLFTSDVAKKRIFRIITAGFYRGTLLQARYTSCWLANSFLLAAANSIKWFLQHNAVLARYILWLCVRPDMTYVQT